MWPSPILGGNTLLTTSVSITISATSILVPLEVGSSEKPVSSHISPRRSTAIDTRKIGSLRSEPPLGRAGPSSPTVPRLTGGSFYTPFPREVSKKALIPPTITHRSLLPKLTLPR